MSIPIAILTLGGLLVEGGREKLNCKDRNSLETCLQQLPPIIDQAELKGIPSSKKDVDHACKAFKTGMGCMDAYFEDCLSENDRKIFESHVAGARHTFRFLCDDPGFQAEYLMYTQCYKGISRDWDACANKFIGLVEEEMLRKNTTDQSRLVELCCAKHGFLKCVYYASWLKCRKEEAIFIRKIADTLASIRVYTPRCKTVNMEICSRSSSLNHQNSNIFGLAMLIMFLVLV
ncbi:uncharacterized protein [Halyomorpha halys]|uniref:uncharacterized protein n=1 Tax=Halyomorpha halys TaxID=286706 RepID=UPI0006D4D701|nr:uncharacterized protein LOC106678060 [Halyomorpha halys]